MNKISVPSPVFRGKPMREFEKEPEELMFNIGLTKQHRTHSGLTGVTS